MAREEVRLVWRVGGEGVNRGDCLEQAKKEASRQSVKSESQSPDTSAGVVQNFLIYSYCILSLFLCNTFRGFCPRLSTVSLTEGRSSARKRR
jgi:hypothetical protein